MKKIISAEQTRAADRHTIAKEPIASIELMERTSNAFIEQFILLFPDKPRVLVLAGVGNNGGDGFAIARILKEKGYKVETYLVKYAEKLSEDCKQNAERLGKYDVIENAQSLNENAEVVVDAIFGSGLNRPVNGWLAELFEIVNSLQKPTVSVDIPSGLFADKMRDGAIIQAEYTITFQRPKLSFFLPETGGYVGDWFCVDIGLDEQFIESQTTNHTLVEAHDVVLKKRPKFSHKGDFGRVQLFAGSIGKFGAASLCAKAIMRSGAGLLTAHVPSSGMQILQTLVPEAMLTLDSNDNHLSSGEVLKHTDVCCFGPGMGTEAVTQDWFRNVLLGLNSPSVFDADALNIIAENHDLLSFIPQGSILTPHVGEFHRLFGHCDNGLERIQKSEEIAQKYKIIIVLKGAHTAIISEEGVRINTTGNPGMATAGSGDVLAGIITGILAITSDSLKAATYGVLLHGLAGDMASKRLGQTSLLASDLLNELPKSIANAELV